MGFYVSHFLMILVAIGDDGELASRSMSRSSFFCVCFHFLILYVFRWLFLFATSTDVRLHSPQVLQ